MLAIGLSADRIDMLLCHGDRILAARRLPLSIDAEAGKWIKSIQGAAKAVQTAAAEMDAVGASAVVLYHSPTECAEYASLSSRSVAEAQQAAILSCADALSCPIDLAVCEAMVMGRDRTGSAPHIHMVISADHDETVSGIASMVQEAGLKFISATPMDAAVMAGLASRALKHADNQVGYLYVGEHRSFFVIAAKGSILFARPISLGLNALVSSLTRPIRMTGTADAIELSAETAREILFRHGFPDRQSVVCEQPHLTGGQIVPLLQPVLQRLIVELRQSLRFALPEDQRESVKLRVCGPGCAVPRFTSIIADELHVQATCDDRYVAYDWQKPESSGSELFDGTMERRALMRLGLQPRHIARKRQAARLRQWLWTGTAAALVLIGTDSARLHHNLVETRIAATAAVTRGEGMKSLQLTGEKLLAAAAAMDKLDAAIARQSGTQLDLGACMHEFARLTPPTIKLTQVTLRQSDGRMLGHVSGYAFETQSSGGRTQLEPFVDQLRASPLFMNVSLTNVQVGTMAAKSGERFELDFGGVAAPRDGRTTVGVADAGSTGTAAGVAP